MNLSSQLIKGFTVVAIAGRLDGVTADTAQKALLDQIAGDVSQLVIDASKLDYLSSAGIRVLLMAAKAVSKKPGGRFAVAAPTPAVRRILCDSGLDEVLSVVNEVATVTG